MGELLKKINNLKNYKTFFIFIAISFLGGILSQSWQFWLIFGIILSTILVIYFSNGFRDFLNIHLAAIVLIVVFALPSTFLLLTGKIELNDQGSLILFSGISIGLIGYTAGALFLKQLFSFEKIKNSPFSKKIDALFWLAYKYRHVLALISGAVLLYYGFMPRAMTYAESIVYRMEVPGALRYLYLLISAVFSVLIIAMISIIGDLERYKKLSWLSYLFIILVIFSIIGGHRSWIISLFACLLIVFQHRLKRKYIVLIIASFVIMTFLISGGVRYARGGESFAGNLKNFSEYFLDAEMIKKFTMKFSDLVRPFSTFIILVENVPQNIPFEYSAYIKDFSLFVPEIAYPDRPLPYNKWFVKTFDPGLFQKGGGFTFYVIGFGYLFAGSVGIFIHLFLFGVLFELLNKFFKMIGTAGLFLYSYFFVQLIMFVRGCGFFVFIKTSLILDFFIPVVLLSLFVLFLDLFSLKKFKILK